MISAAATALYALRCGSTAAPAALAGSMTWSPGARPGGELTPTSARPTSPPLPRGESASSRWLARAGSAALSPARLAFRCSALRLSFQHAPPATLVLSRYEARVTRRAALHRLGVEQAGVPPLLARFLCRARRWRPPSWTTALAQLLPRKALNGTAAALLLADAIEQGRRICVVADYDW